MSSVIRYGSAKLFASDSSNPGSLRAFSLVQNLSIGFDINRERIRSIGSSAIERHVGRPPSVNVDFEYAISNLSNTERFGIPVVWQESEQEKKSILYNIKPVDIALVTDEESRDISSASSSAQQEFKVYVIKNAYLENFKLSVSPGQLPRAQVSLSGDDIVFKIFKNLSEYVSFYEEATDSDAAHKVTFEMEEDGVGGAVVSETLDSFSFDMQIPYRQLRDFGQFYHKREVIFPIVSRIQAGATVNKFKEGDLSEIFCKNKVNEFLFAFSRPNCETGLLEEHCGMVFKNAILESQDYSASTTETLRTNLAFSLDIQKDSGVFFVQKSIVGDNMMAEIGGHLVLEHGGGSSANEGAGKLLFEEITDMMDTLRKI